MYPNVQVEFWPWLGQYEGVFRSDGIRFGWLGLDKLGRPATAYGCGIYRRLKQCPGKLFGAIHLTKTHLSPRTTRYAMNGQE